MIKTPRHKRFKDLKCLCGADNAGNYPRIKVVDLGGRKCKVRCICGRETKVKQGVMSAINAWGRGEYE